MIKTASVFSSTHCKGLHNSNPKGWKSWNRKCNPIMFGICLFFFYFVCVCVGGVGGNLKTKLIGIIKNFVLWIYHFESHEVAVLQLSICHQFLKKSSSKLYSSIHLATSNSSTCCTISFRTCL